MKLPVSLNVTVQVNVRQFSIKRSMRFTAVSSREVHKEPHRYLKNNFQHFSYLKKYCLVRKSYLYYKDKIKGENIFRNDVVNVLSGLGVL